MRRLSPRTLGAEEEFHLVDLKTRRLTARAPELLAELSEYYVAELQRCVIETNTAGGRFARRAARRNRPPPQGLGRNCRRTGHRRGRRGGRAAVGAGRNAGDQDTALPANACRLSTAGPRAVDLRHPDTCRRRGPRHAVAVAYRVAAYLPTLLALSASSPFASDGSDTGYSSMRTLVWQRWPTTGAGRPGAIGRRIRRTGPRPGGQRGHRGRRDGLFRRPPG